MRHIILSFTILIVSIGCSAITDFDAPDTKLDIRTETSNILDIHLADELATLTLTFDNELPDENAESVFDLIGSSIVLTVINETSDVNVSLTDPPGLESPTAAGQYTVNISNDNKSVEITFYNETTSGQALNPGGNYSAVLDIAANDFFNTDNLTFDINVNAN